MIKGTCETLFALLEESRACTLFFGYVSSYFFCSHSALQDIEQEL